MATATDIKPADALHALLVPITTEAQRTLEENPDLKRLSQRYQATLSTANTETAHVEIGNIVRELNTLGLFQPDPDRVWQTIDQRVFEDRPIEEVITTENRSTENPLARAIQNFQKQQRGSTRSGSFGDVATQPLQSLEEEQLVREFQDAIATGSDAKIASLEHQAIELDGENGLLQRQLNIALEHVGQLTPDQIRMYIRNENLTKEQLAQQIREQWKIQKDKRSSEQKTERERQIEIQQKQREQQLRQDLEKAKKSEDKDKRIAAYRALVHHQINQTTDYSPFAYLYEQRLEGTPYILSILLNQTLRQMQVARLQEQAMEAQEQMSNATNPQRVQQRQNPRSNGLASQTLKVARNRALSFVKKQIRNLIIEFIVDNPWVWAVVGIVLLVIVVIILLIILIITIIVLVQHSNQQGSATPIPGLTLTVDTNPPGKTTYDNGQPINVVIDVTYTGQYSLDIINSTPDNAKVAPNKVSGTSIQGYGFVEWNLDQNTPLPDSTSTKKHWQLDLTLNNIGTNLVFHDSVTAQYVSGSGPNSNQKTKTTTGPTSALPQASGYCSPTNLAGYFGGLGEGQIASCICQYESGGDPGVINNACIRGGTADWSVGLFQINLDTNPQRCSGAFSRTGKSCAIANQSKLNSCTTSLQNPVTNIKQAVAIYQASHDSWNSGWTAEKGKCF